MIFITLIVFYVSLYLEDWLFGKKSSVVVNNFSKKYFCTNKKNDFETARVTYSKK